MFDWRKRVSRNERFRLTIEMKSERPVKTVTFILGQGIFSVTGEDLRPVGGVWVTSPPTTGTVIQGVKVEDFCGTSSSLMGPTLQVTK